MNILIITLSALISITAVAQDVPNTFQPGSPIVASEVNENFQSLKNRIDVLEAQLAEQQAENTPREFVGITTATTTGAAGGLPVLDQMCAAEFTGSTACRDIDYASYLSSDSRQRARIIPTKAALLAQLGGEIFLQYGATSEWPSCRDFTSLAGRSLVIDRGNYIFPSCETAYPIACCK